MNAASLTLSRSVTAPVTEARRTRSDVAVHRFVEPSVREMTPAETEAQRRLVRASLLAKPA